MERLSSDLSPEACSLSNRAESRCWDLDLDLANPGNSNQPQTAIRQAAMLTGTSQEALGGRFSANSLGATVLKCCSSCSRLCWFNLSAGDEAGVSAAGVLAVTRTNSIVCFSR